MTQAKRGGLPPTIAKAEKELVAFAMALPEAVEEWPWGDRAFKVRKKVFTFLVCSDDALKFTAKLRDGHAEADHLPFTEATGYGLGKAGWITARFEPGEEVPVTLLEDWMVESYRLVAPKKLVATLES
jgi:predicted DNA-binding protein (MmcQ/YjbR family)